MSLAFRHAIVVGASSGIGAEIARQLAADGCAVALLGRRAEELEKLRAEIAGRGRGSAITTVHDVTRYDTVPALLDQPVQECGHGVVARDVVHRGDRAAPAAPRDLGTEPFELLGPAAEQRDGTAVRGELARDLGADAGAGAHDDGVAEREAHAVLRASRRPSTGSSRSP